MTLENEQPAAETSGETETPQDEPKPNREARYRVERNEARAERDTLSARIEQFQVREIQRLAESELAQPTDLLSIGGVSLAELVDEHGFVNPEAVADAVTDLLEQRPGLARNPRQAAIDRSQGSGGSGKAAPSWSDLFN